MRYVSKEEFEDWQKEIGDKLDTIISMIESKSYGGTVVTRKRVIVEKGDDNVSESGGTTG